ncbi:hypothetical protein Ancab_007904 [Ancistrocladus abbreviatus]
MSKSLHCLGFLSLFSYCDAIKTLITSLSPGALLLPRPSSSATHPRSATPVAALYLGNPAIGNHLLASWFIAQQFKFSPPATPLSVNRLPSAIHHSSFSTWCAQFQVWCTFKEQKAMAALSNRGKMLIQNENFEVHRKKAPIDGKLKTSKTAVIKGREGTGTRKPLGDLTNKSALLQEVSSKKTNAPQEESSVAGEGFLHDHKKCIEAQQVLSDRYFSDLVLPSCDSLILSETLESQLAEADLDSPSSYPEPKAMPPDWLMPLTPMNSPRSSPIRWDSLLQLEEVEFALKDD